MTAVEIAKLAGVSVATVSRVINNSDSVRPATAAQVHRVFEKAGLDRELLRRSNRSSANGGKRMRQTSIAIATVAQSHAAWFRLPVMAAVVGGITREAKNNALGVQLEDAWTADELVGAFTSRRVSGALVFVPAGADPELPPKLRNLPIVRVMGESLVWAGIDHVGADNEAAGAMAAEYLISRGCRRLGVMSHSPHWEFVRRRAHGFDCTAYRRGLSPAPKMFFLSEDGNQGNDSDYLGSRVSTAETPEELVQAFAANLASSPHRMGIFIPRDEETVLIYRLLFNRGIIPGRDCEIVSCDNEDVRLSALEPRPASIELGTEEIGRRAIQRLISRMSHPDEPEVRLQVCPSLHVEKVI